MSSPEPDRLPQRRPRCPWCQEDTGWCNSTGGPNPCESEPERLAATADVHDAPDVTIPRAARSPWCTSPVPGAAASTNNYTCNACRGQVRWDADTPGYQCRDDDCSCRTDGSMGAFVHVGEDCGHFWWAIGPVNGGVLMRSSQPLEAT